MHLLADCLFPILTSTDGRKKNGHKYHTLHTMSAPNFVLNITNQTKNKLVQNQIVYIIQCRCNEYERIRQYNYQKSQFVYFSTHVAL